MRFFRPWDGPFLNGAEYRRCCHRCGRSDGASLRTEADEALRHRDPDECFTGRPSYDEHARLDLTHGLDGVWPAGGALTAQLRCRDRHEVGRLYGTRSGELLLARRWFGRPFVKSGNQLLRTIAPDYVVPVLLGEALSAPWTGAIAMQCPCRIEFPVNEALVDRLRLVGTPTRPVSVALPM
jgi:hypothetical protein